jgi:hypothetical protein
MQLSLALPYCSVKAFLLLTATLKVFSLLLVFCFKLLVIEPHFKLKLSAKFLIVLLSLVYSANTGV